MAFDDEMIQAVWEKAQVVLGYDPDSVRKDQCGAWIRRNDYGDRKSDFGWEIDHIKPESKNGSDTLSNLRPLQWKNNASRQDGRLTCPVKANGVRNFSF